MRLERSVLLDIDGVLIDSQPEMIKAANSLFGTSVVIGDLVRFDHITHEIIRHTDGRETKETIGPQVYGDEVMIRSLPTKGSQKFVSRTSGVGFTINATTSRPISQTKLTRCSLELHFPQIGKLRMGGDPYSPFAGKYNSVMELRPVIYLDDDGRVITYLHQAGVSNHTLLGLIDKPWNQDFPIRRDGRKVRRFGFWPDNDYEWGRIFELICRL